MIQNIFIALLILIVAACVSSHSFLQPTEKDAVRMSTGKKKIELEELQEGYKLYVANCGGCHSLHVPSEKIKKEWDVILPKMFPKTHLTSDQQQLIKIYIYSKL